MIRRCVRDGVALESANDAASLLVAFAGGAHGLIEVNSVGVIGAHFASWNSASLCTARLIHSEPRSRSEAYRGSTVCVMMARHWRTSQSLPSCGTQSTRFGRSRRWARRFSASSRSARGYLAERFDSLIQEFAAARDPHIAPPDVLPYIDYWLLYDDVPPEIVI